MPLTVFAIQGAVDQRDQKLLIELECLWVLHHSLPHAIHKHQKDRASLVFLEFLIGAELPASRCERVSVIDPVKFDEGLKSSYRSIIGVQQKLRQGRNLRCDIKS